MGEAWRTAPRLRICGGELWFERIWTVNGQFGLALDSEKAKEIRVKNSNVDTCIMCMELCSIQMMRDMMGK